MKLEPIYKDYGWICPNSDCECEVNEKEEECLSCGQLLDWDFFDPDTYWLDDNPSEEWYQGQRI